MSMANDQPDERVWATAYHEAGHAVAGVVFGHHFDDITIVPDGVQLGAVSFEPLDYIVSNQVSHGSNEDEDRRLRERVIIVLAGPTAEARFTGRLDLSEVDDDYETAIDI